jgi:hypothetical protein
MQGEHFDCVVRIRRRVDTTEADLSCTPAALRRKVLARVIDEHATHHLCGNAIELRSILPFALSLVDEAHVCLVHQGGRLERVAGILTAHRRGSAPVKFGVYDRKETFAGIGISTPPRAKQLSNVSVLGHQQGILNWISLTRKPRLDRLIADPPLA